MSTISKPVSALTTGDTVHVERGGTVYRYVVKQIDSLRSGRLRVWANPSRGSWGRVTPAILGTFPPATEFTVEAAESE